MFYPFIDDAEVELIGAEAGGRGLRAGDHASSLTQGKPGVLHGSFSYVLQDDDGQTQDVHSISAGLDYPGRRTGAQLLEGHRAGCATRASPTPRRSTRITPRPAARGSCPRSSPATPWPRRSRKPAGWAPGKVLVVCLSGRGDKDAYEVARLRGEPIT